MHRGGKWKVSEKLTAAPRTGRSGSLSYSINKFVKGDVIIMKNAKRGILGLLLAMALMAVTGCGMGDTVDDGTGTTRNNGTNDSNVNSVTNGTDDTYRTTDDDNIVEDAVDGARDIGEDVVDGVEDLGEGAADVVDDAVQDRGAGADNSTANDRTNQDTSRNTDNRSNTR